jgi:hypothetical protein
MQEAAILSKSEAAAGIRDYRAARDGDLPAELVRYGGGEAVTHFGGPLAVIEAAINGRRTQRRHFLSDRVLGNIRNDMILIARQERDPNWSLDERREMIRVLSANLRKLAGLVERDEVPDPFVVFRHGEEVSA